MRLLFVLDMDGTITPSSSWSDVHEHFGTLEKAREHKKLFLDGGMSYEEWMARDISLWNMPPARRVYQILSRFSLVPGFPEFRGSFPGAVFAIVSAGIEQRARMIARRYGIHEVLANPLVSRNRRVVGAGSRVNPLAKGVHVRALQKEYKPDYTIAIGDSVLDEDMFRHADLSISLCDRVECATHHARDFFVARRLLEKEFWR